MRSRGHGHGSASVALLHADGRSLHLVGRFDYCRASSQSLAARYDSGGARVHYHDSGHELLFRQESYFQHLFGVKEPGWVGTVEVPSGTCTLFAPELPKSYAVWHVRGVFVTLELDAVAAMA